MNEAASVRDGCGTALSGPADANPAQADRLSVETAGLLSGDDCP